MANSTQRKKRNSNPPKIAPPQPTNTVELPGLSVSGETLVELENKIKDLATFCTEKEIPNAVVIGFLTLLVVKTSVMS